VNNSELISLYYHIPFCAHRCAYCDFNTYAGQEDSIPAYVEALQKEIQIVGRSTPANLQVHTIFFGGGTPSLLNASQLEFILNSIQSNFPLTTKVEISLEANPGTCSPEFLQDIRRLGFNRISFGVQSANPNELRLLERIHDYGDVVNAVKWSRQAGFDNLNIDLIYGLPEQKMADWQRTVNLILGLHPEHLSLYALTLEHGTPFGRWSQRGLMPTPNPDTAAEMYEWAEGRLASDGYDQYEISNWSKPGMECRHNLQYWRNLTYLGFGAGAHGHGGGYRCSNVLRIRTYIDRLLASVEDDYPFPLSPASVNRHLNSSLEEIQETMMTGLRLTHEGISSGLFRQRFDIELMDLFGDEIDELVRLGLLEWYESLSSETCSDKCLRLTRKGKLLGNQVFMRFVGD
jgi:oxygen-independent coproporphyrinogen-3 oxidase